MITLALTVVTASLLGSLHCAGMCGGFVAFVAGDGPRRRCGLGVHLAHGLGRLLAYVVLGAGAGFFGAALNVAGSVAGIQRGAAIVAGTLIVVWGSATLVSALGVRVPEFHRSPRAARACGTSAGPRLARPPRIITTLLAAALRRLATQPPGLRALVVGLLTGCLPCGWLWAFVVTAAGTGSAPTGALVMAAFWLGTMPVMVSLGLGVHALAGPLRRHVPAACAVLMILIGVFAVAGRAGVIGPPRHSAAHVPADANATLGAAPHARH